MKIHISPTGYGGYAVRWTEGGSLHTRYTMSHYEALMIREELKNSSTQWEGGVDYEIVDSNEALPTPRLEF